MTNRTAALTALAENEILWSIALTVTVVSVIFIAFGFLYRNSLVKFYQRMSR